MTPNAQIPRANNPVFHKARRSPSKESKDKAKQVVAVRLHMIRCMVEDQYGTTKRYGSDRYNCVDVRRVVIDVQTTCDKEIDEAVVGARDPSNLSCVAAGERDEMLEREPTYRELDEVLWKRVVNRIHHLAKCNSTSPRADSAACEKALDLEAHAAFEQMVLDREVQDIIHQMAHPHGTILRMRFYDNMPLTDIARALQMTYGEIRGLYRRALQRFRDKFGGV